MRVDFLLTTEDGQERVGWIRADGDTWRVGGIDDLARENLMAIAEALGPPAPGVLADLEVQYSGSMFRAKLVADSNDDPKKGFEAEVYKTAGEHTFASTQLELKSESRDEILSIAEAVPAFALEPTKGRETDPHVTVLYGLKVEDHGDVRKALEGVDRTVMTTLKGVEVFEGVEGGTCDAIVVLCDPTPALVDLREKLMELPHAEPRFAFTPHITLAYVKLGQGLVVAELVRPLVEKLTVPIMFEAVTFRDRLGRKHDISLGPVMSMADEEPGWKTVSFLKPIKP